MRISANAATLTDKHKKKPAAGCFVHTRGWDQNTVAAPSQGSMLTSKAGEIVGLLGPNGDRKDDDFLYDRRLVRPNSERKRHFSDQDAHDHFPCSAGALGHGLSATGGIDLSKMTVEKTSWRFWKHCS